MQIDVAIRPVADLAPYSRNARRHPAAAVARLVAIIEEMGWTNPILVDEAGIVAGHKRRLAALAIYEKGGTIRLPNGRALPAGMVPVLDVSGWNEAQRRAYILADNQTTLESEWDADVLRLELSWLEGAEIDIGLTGFDGDALAKALGVTGGHDGPDPDPLKVKLADRFGVPPFSVLRAAEGWWQDRKRAWLALGIQSELGRGEGDRACPGGSPMPGRGSRAGYGKPKDRRTGAMPKNIKLGGQMRPQTFGVKHG